MKSMTGYGRAKGFAGETEITIELKSVNNRFFETSLRVPRIYNFAENAIKKKLQEGVSRGKIDYSLTYQRTEGSDTKVSVDTGLVEEYLNAIKSASKKLGLKNNIKADNLFRIPEAFILTKKEENTETAEKAILEITAEALKNYNDMRKAEGERLKSDLAARLDHIAELSEKIEKQNADTVKEHTERLYEKLKELVGDRNIDDARVLTEAAIFADKVCINEEAVRLRSHVVQFKEIMELDEPVGKKLDFLTQELNREANTTGSKCQDSNITQMVIELKAEIEKIREQVQNIE
jgi:uncharacterized protein (TIGR00255 family)